jgi:hypothetical protein
MIVSFLNNPFIDSIICKVMFRPKWEFIKKYTVLLWHEDFMRNSHIMTDLESSAIELLSIENRVKNHLSIISQRESL